MSFSAIDLLIVVACLLASMFFGRHVKTVACCFLPFDPLTILFAVGLFAINLLAPGSPLLTAWLIVTVTGYVIGYFIGSFSSRGIVELSMDKKIVLKAYNIAYYYSAEERSYCIQEQTPKAVFLRIFFKVHHPMVFDFERIQSRTQISVNNNYFSLNVNGAMTYVLIKEPRTVSRGRFSFNADIYRFIPTDITEKGPYDFFLRTELYLAAMDIADRAKAKQLESDIRARKSAAEGGATILESICKMEPEDAAATLQQLRSFVDSETKTVAETEEQQKEETKTKIAEPVKRRWFGWRKKNV